MSVEAVAIRPVGQPSPRLRVITPQIMPLTTPEIDYSNDLADFGFETEAPSDVSEAISLKIASVFKITNPPLSINSVTEDGIGNISNFRSPRIIDFNRKSKRWEVVESVLQNSEATYETVRNIQIQAAIMHKICMGEENTTGFNSSGLELNSGIKLTNKGLDNQPSNVKDDEECGVCKKHKHECIC